MAAMQCENATTETLSQVDRSAELRRTGPRLVGPGGDAGAKQRVTRTAPSRAFVSEELQGNAS